MIVNKNSNQSPALKLVCFHMCHFFFLFRYLQELASKCTICVCLYLRFAITVIV